MTAWSRRLALLGGLALAAAQLSGSAYLTNVLIVVALHAVPAVGLSLLMGYTGQISIGHAAFYGLGAYGSGLLAVRAGLDPWLAVPVSAAGVAGLAWGLGWLIFRLRGHHLAVATLGMGIIVYVALVELRGWTGGPNGLPGIPPLHLSGRALDSDFRFYPVAWGASPSPPPSWPIASSGPHGGWRCGPSGRASGPPPRSGWTWPRSSATSSS